jgi:hypothetical protein
MPFQLRVCPVWQNTIQTSPLFKCSWKALINYLENLRRLYCVPVSANRQSPRMPYKLTFSTTGNPRRRPPVIANLIA